MRIIYVRVFISRFMLAKWLFILLIILINVLRGLDVNFCCFLLFLFILLPLLIFF